MRCIRFVCRKQRLDFVFQSLKRSIRPYSSDCSRLRPSCGLPISRKYCSGAHFVRKHMLESRRGVSLVSNSLLISVTSPATWSHGQLRFYSSEGGGSNTSDNGVKVEKSKHADFGEQEQKEWLTNEKLALESKKNEPPFLSKREKFKYEFSRRIVPWEKITTTWESFPYFLDEHTKSSLVECVASRLKQNKFASDYGAQLSPSSGRILLQGEPGTELYRERLIRAVAHDAKVPLLVLDGSILAPFDFGKDSLSENESDDDEHTDSDEDSTLDSYSIYTSSSESDSDDDDKESTSKKSDATKDQQTVSTEKQESGPESRPLRKGDRIKYVGPSVRFVGERVKYIGPSAYAESDTREIQTGQRGEVHDVEEDRIAVILDNNEKDTREVEKVPISPIHWLLVKDVEHDLDDQAEDYYVAMEALCQVLQSKQPLIVYFVDSCLWLARAAPKTKRKEFVSKVRKMFDQLSGPVVLICGKNKVISCYTKRESFRKTISKLGHQDKLPLGLRRLTEGLRHTRDSRDVYKLFTNIMCISPPKKEEQLKTFEQQLVEDRRIAISRSNFSELQKLLEEHNLSCLELLQIDTDGVALTKQNAEQVVGRAKNQYLASCLLPSIEDERLILPRSSLEVAILRLKQSKESPPKESSNRLEELAMGYHEKMFVSAVVPPGEIGVQFDDVGALEHVKKALDELIILPMRRPELFAHGNLLRPCKGMLLFGPPGTGKTLIAKALAAESGANFITVTNATLTSMWHGEEQKYTKALFTFASKLAKLGPVIIFIDEIDAMLGARGKGFEQDITRKMRNEFMTAWDGLRTQENERVLILGATNRPFDIDDAVLRRMPRRILVDLPDAENRMKILKIQLAKENLETGFSIEELAKATEGYSGSDLKNLCMAAAYRPVQELLEEEKVCKETASTTLRRLRLDDFIESKSKVGASVSSDSTSIIQLREWAKKYGEGGSSTKTRFEDLADNKWETEIVPAVVPPGEIGVQFDDVGALEDVKKALDELILPMRRPELFAHGNLLRPCKGMLLFGPPGTGKTLIAKALAAESGANFITVTNATLTSKWHGEEQKYTKALFTFASKLAKLGPVIIFIDEIDAMLGARGKGFEQDITRKMRNEFMTAWDGLRTQENERVLILGATNRPFDIDDAVIRRMPRRILVDLPDASNRMKILKIQLAKESLETGFSIEELAKATEGYSGSDLKNLCIAAAYRPVQELLEEEKVCKETASTTLRRLRLDDFIQSKSKVGASVSRDSTSIIELREWNKKYGEGGSRTESPPIGF